jgi:hypothetical protein
MNINNKKRALGLFPTRRDAESALRKLQESGFAMDRVSIIARDGDRGDRIAGVDVNDRSREDRGNKADEGATTGAVAGGALGGITGLLVGLGTLAIPGIGPIMLAGAGATALATTLAGGAIGAASGGLVGALIGLGIPEERARVYHDRVARGDYLLMVDGTEAEIARAQRILDSYGIREWGVYDVPANNVATAEPTGDRAVTRDTYASASEIDTPDRFTEALSTEPRVNRNVEPDPTVRKSTVNRSLEDSDVISDEPEVIIVDRRSETDRQNNL